MSALAAVTRVTQPACLSLFALSATSTSVTRARLRVCLKHLSHSQGDVSVAEWNQHIQWQSGEQMFSLRETESGKFIYRCHGCGWERELTATERVAAADEALACNKTHKCSTELPSPKAS